MVPSLLSVDTLENLTHGETKFLSSLPGSGILGLVLGRARGIAHLHAVNEASELPEDSDAGLEALRVVLDDALALGRKHLEKESHPFGLLVKLVELLG